MADNTVLNPGVGGDVIATDEIAGVKHELVKVEFGGDGVATMVDAANPLPVKDLLAEAALASIASEDFATSANQGTEISALTAILAKLSSDPATQTTLAAILAKIITAPSTEAKQDAANALLTTIAAITQPLTDAQLRATPVPVSISGGGGGAVTIADGADIAEGAIADAIVAAGAAGTLSAKLRRATQGLEDLKTLISVLPLPTGASTSALQTTGNTSLATIAGKDFATQATLAAILAKIISAPSTEAKQDIIITALNSIDAGTAAALGQALMAASVPVVIASDQSPIPFSAASLPLPTGASTESTLASILAKIIASPATEATLALIKAKTDNIDVALSTRTKPSDQQHVIIDSGGGGATTIADGADVAEGAIADAIVAAGAAGTVSAKLRRATQGLEDLKAGITALPLPTGAATGAKQDTGNTSLASILAKIIAAPSTEAKQDTIITALATLLTISDFDTKTGSLTETAPATDTASSGLNGRLQRIAQRLTSLITALGTPFQAGGSIGNTSFASTIADAANVVEGALADAIVAAGATGSISAKLRRATQGLEDLKTLIVLAAGSAIIGKVGIDQTTPGTTNAVVEASAAAILAKVTAAAASFVKLEDVASADADAGVPMLAVRKATPANTSGSDGDYEFLQMSAGKLWVQAGATQKPSIGATVVLAVTALQSLASSATVGWGSVRVSNLATLATDYEIFVKLTTANTAPANDKAAYVWVCPFYTTDAGSTWFASSQGTATLPSGTDAASTIASPHNLRLLGVLNYTTQQMVLQDTFLLSNCFGNRLPDGFSIIITNFTGAALSTGCVVDYSPLNDILV